MKTIRFATDRLFQRVIRLFMLTGVTFLVTACYGVQPQYSQEEQEDVAQIEDTLKNEYEQGGN